MARRKQDKLAVECVTNGQASIGSIWCWGARFLFGDGTLTYRRENILESYRALQVWRGVFTSFDLQPIDNPGYNRDRGPLLVPSLKLHLKF